MKLARAFLFFSLLAVLAAGCGSDDSPPALRVAVAGNFAAPLRELAESFEAATDRAVSVSVGSTGSLHSQITQGAPFDVFLAADVARPRMLEEVRLAAPGSRTTYAIGRIVLWSPDPARDLGLETLHANWRSLAIANPETAPYGLAARQLLQREDLWERLRADGKIVEAQSVGQTLEFVRSGSAELGVLALSQVRALPVDSRGSHWLVPADAHDSIEQQVVILTDTPAARAFVDHLQSQGARELLERYGYEVP